MSYIFEATHFNLSFRHFFILIEASKLFVLHPWLKHYYKHSVYCIFYLLIYFLKSSKDFL